MGPESLWFSMLLQEVQNERGRIGVQRYAWMHKDPPVPQTYRLPFKFATKVPRVVGMVGESGMVALFNRLGPSKGKRGQEPEDEAKKAWAPNHGQGSDSQCCNDAKSPSNFSILAVASETTGGAGAVVVMAVPPARGPLAHHEITRVSTQNGCYMVRGPLKADDEGHPAAIALQRQQHSPHLEGGRHTAGHHPTSTLTAYRSNGRGALVNRKCGIVGCQKQQKHQGRVRLGPMTTHSLA